MQAQKQQPKLCSPMQQTLLLFLHVWDLCLKVTFCPVIKEPEIQYFSQIHLLVKLSFSISIILHLPTFLQWKYWSHELPWLLSNNAKILIFDRTGSKSNITIKKFTWNLLKWEHHRGAQSLLFFFFSPFFFLLLFKYLVKLLLKVFTHL